MLALVLALTGIGNAFAQTAGERVPIEFNELPAVHRELFESEMASALANARARLPGSLQLFAEARGTFNGYQGAKENGGVSVTYTVSDSMVAVGETIYFNADLRCIEPPMKYTVSGLVMDERFNLLGELGKANGESELVNSTECPIELYYTPREPGYVNFVLVVTDEHDGRVAFTTNTVQVCSREETLFNNVAMDDSLGLILSLDSTSVRVGSNVTATAVVMTENDPVEYTAEWILCDEQGNTLDLQRTTNVCNAQQANATLTFPYQPLQAGDLRFEITAKDGAGKEVSINTPYMHVADGFFFEAKLDRTVAGAGESVTGTYRIHGHDCESTSCYIGWATYAEDASDEKIETRSSVVTRRNGQDSFSPRTGKAAEFYVGATCEHYPSTYPVSAQLTLLDGLTAEIILNKDPVVSGESMGASYSVSGGKTPSREIVINGFSRDPNGQEYTFFQQSAAEAEGSIQGKPWLGSEVWFELGVTEADGFRSNWKSKTVALTGAPEVTKPVLKAQLDRQTIRLGESVSLSWQMTGGSGTINSDKPSASFAAWKKVDGTIVSSTGIKAVSGNTMFTPDTAGKYVCILQVTDGYSQTASWTSEIFEVTTENGSDRIPGDADGNGRVSMDDALLILRHCNDANVVIHTSNADVNANGIADHDDALLILQHVSGWKNKLR